MSWDISYAVAISILTVAVSGLAGQLAATKRWHKWVFWGAGLLTVMLIYLQAQSTENQTHVASQQTAQLQQQLTELRGKMDHDKRASVSLYDLHLWPNQELIPGKNISAQILFTVTEGEARNYRIFDEMVSLEGRQSDTLDKRAVEQFRKDSTGKFDYRGQDKTLTEGSQKTLQIKLDKEQISQFLAATRTIYVLGRVEWNNPAGADFHTDVCYYLQPPGTKYLNNLGWHMCRP